MHDPTPDRLSALGHPQRLAIFRLLMRRYPDRVPAGEIAAALDLPASSLSAYLSTLVQAGLLERARRGTSVRYAVAMDGVREVFGALLGACCGGRPDLCVPEMAGLPAPAPAPAQRRVLFVCTGNSARSLFAECLLRDMAGDRFDTASAGTAPRPAPHPEALALLRARGHDPSRLFSTDLADALAAPGPGFDFVFTVCDAAANAERAAWPGRPLTAHWGVPDPAAAPGAATGAADASRAFAAAYDALAARIRAFAALPLDTLDRAALQGALDGIARMGGAGFGKDYA